MANTSEWTTEIEDILLDYALEAETLYYVYNKSVLIYKKFINWYQIPSIIISSITGALLFDKEISTYESASYVLASMNIIIAILQTLLKFFNYTELESQCMTLSIEYLKIYEEIRLQLQLEQHKRHNAGEFLDKITKQREHLYSQFSIIQDKIRSEFKKRHKNLDLPLKLNHINEIKIYGRESHIKNIESKTPSMTSSVVIDI